ncbi:unnamed protein product [Effrenium voratum]|nr:unnamed protein product [Effrenium voratum]
MLLQQLKIVRGCGACGLLAAGLFDWGKGVEAELRKKVLAQRDLYEELERAPMLLQQLKIVRGCGACGLLAAGLFDWGKGVEAELRKKVLAQRDLYEERRFGYSRTRAGAYASAVAEDRARLRGLRPIGCRPLRLGQGGGPKPASSCSLSEVELPNQ